MPQARPLKSPRTRSATEGSPEAPRQPHPAVLDKYSRAGILTEARPGLEFSWQGFTQSWAI